MAVFGHYHQQLISAVVKCGVAATVLQSLLNYYCRFV